MEQIHSRARKTPSESITHADPTLEMGIFSNLTSVKLHLL